MSKKSVRPSDEFLSPKHKSHRARQERMDRIAKISTYGVIGLVVSILVFGALYEYSWKPNKAVARVGDQKITLADYQGLYAYRAVTLWDELSTLNDYVDYFNSSEDLSFLVSTYESEIETVQQEIQELPTTVLDELLNYAIARREAEARGIVITDEEVQLEVESTFGYDREADAASATAIAAAETITATLVPTATTVPTAIVTDSITTTETVTATVEATATPTEVPMTQEEYETTADSYFTSIEAASGYTKEDLYKLVENSLYLEAVQNAIMAEAPTTAEQIYLWRMAFDTEEEAQTARELVLAGASFEEMAQEREENLDMSVSAEVGWVPAAQMSDALAEVAFALEVGETSEPVETSNGWELLKVTDQAEDMELDEYSLSLVQEDAADAWFAEQRAADDVKSYWTSSMIPDL